MTIKFCVTLTSIPSRIKNLNKVINSIENQSLKPDKIFLNIPTLYKRFPNDRVSNEDIKKLNNSIIEITRCDDFGPGTKLLGSLNKIVKYDTAIIIDDDSIYHRDFCKILISEYLKNQDQCYSFYLNKIFNIKMGQFVDGLILNTKHLDKIEDFFNKYVLNNYNMFFDDDLWFAIYIQLIKKKKIDKILDVFQKKTGENVVFKNLLSDDALNKSIHGPQKILNRRKIQKIEYIKFFFKKYFYKSKSLFHFTK